MRTTIRLPFYNDDLINQRFTAHDTQFNVVNGKINAMISESEITELIGGGKTMYTRLTSAESTIDGISTQVSSINTQVLGNGSTSIKSRLSVVEQSATSISSRVSSIESNGVTKSNIGSVITQTAGSINISVFKNNSNYATTTQVQSTINASADAIRLKTTNLAWNSAGSSMTEAGRITCTSGNIGGWEISSLSFSKELSGYRAAMYVPNGATPATSYVFWIQNKNNSTNPFYVRADGYLYSENANIAGKITATSGNLGGWTINSSSISGSAGGWTTSINKPTSTSTNVLSVTDGSSTPFRVTANGKLYSTNAEITGKITATSGTLGGWTINSSSISGSASGWKASFNRPISQVTHVFEVTDGSSTPFYVTTTGLLNATNANITGRLKTELNDNYGVEISGSTVSCTNNNLEVGYMGATHHRQSNLWRGITFNLKYGGYYMAWNAIMESGGDNWIRFMYSNKTFNDLQKDTFYMFAPLNMQANSIENFKAPGNTPCVTATIEGWYKHDINSNTWYQLKIVVKNGLIVGLYG